MSQKRASNALGSWPIRSGVRSVIVPTTPCGERPSLHSPQPVMPSSVSTFTKVQGRQPALTIKVSMSVIFIVFLSELGRHMDRMHRESEDAVGGLLCYAHCPGPFDNSLSLSPGEHGVWL